MRSNYLHFRHTQSCILHVFRIIPLVFASAESTHLPGTTIIESSSRGFFTGSPATTQPPTMNSLRLLGYAESIPAVFAVDRASPHSQVSASFLFRNFLHAKLDSAGCNYACLMVLIPSQGGYYTSSSLQLASSVTCTAVDVILGADWLASCRVTAGVNVLQQPTPERCRA